MMRPIGHFWNVILTKTALNRITSQTAAPTAFSTKAIERFGRAMRENITSGANPFRKAYIQTVVDRIEPDDHASASLKTNQRWNKPLPAVPPPPAEFADVYRSGARDAHPLPRDQRNRESWPADKQKSNHLAQNGLAFPGKPSIAVRTGSR
jgi:hypothetical protein